ncbi:receptor-type guanylate cyclase Gyc76C-like isoform X2 [Coccinella septempunctata]|uniref:receptor-type guanylate cyclase Gyc76C-like isoform X2 n=1 Tax=Coccinella septempunctata TaxID=41139 RepID=UPI001D06F5EB|nr:receptor-type guanylate cyclase Gyc76C-like isoform X2 [Coccinella septempunctata]
MRLGPTLLLVALLYVCHGVSSDPYKADSLYPDPNVTSISFPSFDKNTIDGDDATQTRHNLAIFNDEILSHAHDKFEDWYARENVSSAGNLTAESLKTEVALKKKVITVGYLAAVKGELKERQGLTISGAVQMAIDNINRDPRILPNVTLEMQWNDTKGDTVIATKAMTEMICGNVYAFFGPEGNCYVEAIVAQSQNIPMISYKCSDYKASKIPTFARTEPPDTQVTKSIISLLDYYKWYKFSVIYEAEWETVARSLILQAPKKNMTVTGERHASDRLECCVKGLKCCQQAFWYKFLQETKNRTRIYVFLGNTLSLVDMMTTMQTLQLFENGEYIVIYVDTNMYSDKDAHKYLWKHDVFDTNNSCDSKLQEYQSFLKRARSLFVIVPTAPTQNYESFTNMVKHYTSQKPFGFETSDILKGFATYVSIYAAYLYDSVILYATALDNILSEEPIINDYVIEEIARNGTRIVEAIIKMGSYRSVTGAMMKLDENGDSEGNFSVLALRPTPNSRHVYGHFQCPYQMRPVGQFFQQFDDFPEYKINPNTQIEWATGKDKPNDEPSCGFDNQLCPKANTQLNSIIAVGVLSVLLFCVGVITMSIYRKWKIEQEIEGLLWKIDRDEILSYFERDISSPTRVFSSQVSLVSNSVTSFESRGGLQVFATTALYRGVVVRIKELAFSRKKDISRDVMKEMRLLRELRHDNVNSFIGACVEPNSLLLVTDYCAKGSLYDIIENEDIKLDKMFIASLIHDLIKGMLYLHNSMLVCHGNLKSSNCVVTSRWVLQVTDFGLYEMRHWAENESIGEHQYYRNLFWRAPEILRDPNAYIRGSQKGDVYAFAIILYEILGRKGPFGVTDYEPKEIINLVKNFPSEGEEPFRPNTELLLDTEVGCEDDVLQCMRDCWAENPEHRPDFVAIRTRLKKLKDGKKKNIIDQMMDMMESYATNLEDVVMERTRLLYEEKMKTEDLLHRMLPKPVSERLTKGYGVEPESFDSVTVYFSDIVGFTAMSAESTPLQVVNFLNDLYTVFDRITKGYDVYKVETIGDAYVVVSGLPLRNGDRHAGEIASMALDMLGAVSNYRIAHRPNDILKLRIGIHTGPVVAGVVGLTMPRYCLFGDTVNTASRMESNGEPLRIHISSQCKEALEKLGGYVIEERGLVNMKGKGNVKTFWLVGATEWAIQRREVDLEELPPLFCRPRKSPKLNNDSRQPSFCGGFGGLTSRRHSSVPRGTSIEVESISTIQNSSPLPSRHLKVNRHNLIVPEHNGSKVTINTAFGSGIIEVPEDNKRGLRPRRVLSSIASSCDESNRSQLIKIRESRSLDPIPPTKNKILDPINKLLRSNRSTRSLDNCEKGSKIQIIAITDENLVHNYANGNVLACSNEDNSLMEDVQIPLLNTNAANPTIIRKRGGNGFEDIIDNEENDTSKRFQMAIPRISTSIV